MPPRKGRRHTFAVGQVVNGILELAERVPFTYRDLADNRRPLVREGDSWHVLAARYFAGRSRAAGLWWAIADYQRGGPIVDPTVPPPVGSRVDVPSLLTLDQLILGDRRRRDH